MYTLYFVDRIPVVGYGSRIPHNKRIPKRSLTRFTHRQSRGGGGAVQTALEGRIS